MNIFHPDTPRPWLGVAWTALTVSALAVGGCAGSPSTRYYVVTPVAARAPSNTAYAGPAIEVRVVQVPPALDRLEMVRDSDPGRVEVLDFDHWAAPLGRLARQTLTEDLARRLPPDKVVIPGAAWPGPRASLTVDILSYANRGGSATLSLSWSLQPPAGDPSAPVAATLQVQTPAGGDAAGDARAWSELLGQVADAIAQRLVR